MSIPKTFQTQFMTTISPAHHGHQNYLHQDVHHHLSDPLGNIVRPLAQDNHRPLYGQTTLNDFMLQKKPGLW
jgi:hypothetical protein